MSAMNRTRLRSPLRVVRDHEDRHQQAPTAGLVRDAIESRGRSDLAPLATALTAAAAGYEIAAAVPGLTTAEHRILVDLRDRVRDQRDRAAMLLGLHA